MKKLSLAVLVLLVVFGVLQAQGPETINFYLTPSLSAQLVDKSGSFIKDFPGK